MFRNKKQIKEYKAYVKKRLDYLNEIFALASIGDFSKDVKIPEEEDEFAELYAGIQVMLDVIREKIFEIEADKASLEVERNQLKTLVDNLPVGVMIVDAKTGKPVVTNEMTERLLGVEPKAELGWEEFSKSLNLVRSEDGEYPTDELPLVTTIKRQVPAEKRDIAIRETEEKMKHLKIQSAPVFNEKHEMYSAVAVIDDISKEKRLEQMKSDFISLASHQLRTPLGSMRWMMEMLLKGNYGELESETKEVVERMHNSVKKLVGLVGELLSVFRIEEGRSLDDPEEVDIVETIKTVESEVEPLAKERSVEIDIADVEDLPKIVIDESKLSDVIQNLMSNAIKYNKEGGRVGVTAKKKGDRIILSFSDTGIGIADDEKDRVFEKFFRTEEAAKREMDGTGLGLYLVRSYIEGWGGKVYFESKLGKGSAFTVELPLKPKLMVAEEEVQK